MPEGVVLQSVARALSVLELLDAHGELGVTEISQMLSLEKSTAFRIVSTLKSLEYIVQNPANSKYSNSYKLFQMGSNVARNTGLPKLAHPFMHELSSCTGEAVNLAVLDGNRALYISKIESTDSIKVCMNLGQTIPLHCTGLGKALIAHLPEKRIRELLQDEPFCSFTPNTILNIDELVKELKKIREQGYSVDNEEHIRGIRCIASPVFDSTGQVPAAISIALPQFRFDENPDGERLYDLVRDVARRFSASLGWSP